jgi:hypothetical protein
MATADDYAAWIVKNADKKGTPEFETVVQAYQLAKQEESAPPKPAEEPKPQAGPMDVVRGWRDLLAGGIRGAGSIGATLLASPKDLHEATLGRPSSISERGAAMDAALADLLGADTKSLAYNVGKPAAQVAGTLGVGPALGAVAGGMGAAPPVVSALTTAGMTTGNAPVGVAAKTADMLLRSGAGATVGGASAGLIDPALMKEGAIYGAATPPALSALGTAGHWLGTLFSGPAQTSKQQATIQAARDAGYVIPPSQANPSFRNRAIEGAAGKITTAQNASAANAPVTNRLAAQAIKAPSLEDTALQSVRDAANAKYDALAAVGNFKSDATFKTAISGLQPKTIPGTKNADVANLLDALKLQPGFDAQETINSVKQLRFEGFQNKLSLDPTKKALGKVQIGVANELENLIDRNLQAKNLPDLLKDYREARQTLAKVHTVEKALNKASGTVDAAVLAKELSKGKPLSGELRTIAEFAQTFPKAAQTPERMGSLPQWSPLDLFGSSVLGGMGSLATGNIAGAAAGLGLPLTRIGARKAALSPFIQDSLLRRSGNGLLSDPEFQALLYRATPSLMAAD